jgi:molybdate transport system substrate-binding protein
MASRDRNMPDAAEIKLFCTTALNKAMEELAPAFERANGHKLAMTFASAASLAKRIAEGEAADVAIVSAPAVDDLIKQGRMAPGGRVDIAKSGMGVAVRAGAAKPDISSTEAFKRTLLSAKAIAASNPAGGGASGTHFAAVLERLGIADAVKSKLKYSGGGLGGLAGTLVANGEAEIGVQQISELMAAGGVDIVGPLPAELQNTTQFSAGIPVNAKAPDAGKALIAFLTTPAGRKVLKAKGLEPG